MLSISNKPFILSVPNKPFMLSVVILNVVILSVIMLNVLAPKKSFIHLAAMPLTFLLANQLPLALK